MFCHILILIFIISICLTFLIKKLLVTVTSIKYSYNNCDWYLKNTFLIDKWSTLHH